MVKKLITKLQAVIFAVMSVVIGGQLSFANGTNTRPLMQAQFDGINLLIASNDGQGNEMCYWFKHCMNNQIFTFFRVGRRSSSTTTSNTTGITTSFGITWLNSAASSDNIGPVGVMGYGDFVGANHPWRGANTNGEKGKGAYTTIRTATCDSVTIMFDGMAPVVGSITECRCVTVDVWNTLMDPLVEPAEGAVVLDNPLISEHATYIVQANSIAVDVEHRYLKDFTISRYYGMQSMFIGEEYIMTSMGAYPIWTHQTQVSNFRKNAYPHFNRYVELNNDGWLQSSWVRQRDLGLHGGIGEGSIIYAHGSGKSYHVLADNLPVTANENFRWSGIYTWGVPVVNDSNMVAFTGIIDGREALYIDVATTGTYQLTLPSGWHNYYVEECAAGLTVTRQYPTLTISTDGPACAILVLSAEGDLNADGPIDIDDVNMLINIILKRSTYTALADLDNNKEVDIDDLNRLINIMLGKV